MLTRSVSCFLLKGEKEKQSYGKSGRKEVASLPQDKGRRARKGINCRPLFKLLEEAVIIDKSRRNEKVNKSTPQCVSKPKRFQQGKDITEIYIAMKLASDSLCTFERV